MSGPWDRPSSPSPDEGWPEEDLESSSRPHQPADLWSSDDPWQERATEPSPAWDVWPSPQPPADEYVVEDPPPPSSDPWAESWTDDVPGMSIADVPTRSEPDDEVARYATGAETDAPRVEPWSPSSDAWTPASVEPWTPAEPWREAAEDDAAPEPWRDASDEVAAPEPWADAPEREAAPEPWRDVPQDEPARQPSAEPLAPGWPAEPMRPAPPPEPPAEAATGADVVESEPEPVHLEVEPAAAQVEETGPAHAPESPVDPEPLVTTERPSPAVAAYQRAYRAIFPSVADEDEAAAHDDGETEREPEARDVARQDDGPVPLESSAPTVEPVEPALDPGVTPASDAATSPALREPTALPTAEPSWEADLWAEPDAPTERPSEREADWAPEPDADAATAATTPTERDHVPERVADDDWQPAESRPAPSESTQVLPTSWVPPRPSPRDERSALEPESGPVRTSLGTDIETDDEAVARPSTAEQAVPWLIGVILLLAGMVIVLLALIFAGDGSLGGAAALPSGSGVAIIPTASSSEPTATARPSPSAATEASPNATASAIAGPSATPAPQYGALEMVYQGRSAALAPIYLLRHDFTTADNPQVLAQDPNLDLRQFAWAPDGTVGAGLYADLLIAIEPGSEKRNLGDGIVSLAFGRDASTLYAVRLTEEGARDLATVVAIDYASGETSEVRAISYTRPTIGEEEALREGQFADDGGPIRLYRLHDGTLRLWSLGAGAWDIDPESGEFTDVEGVPVLWSPGAMRRIVLTENGGDTTIAVHEGDDEEPAAQTALSGLVSHVRWSPDGERIVFTLGRTTRNGGIVQDLFLWDLDDGVTPTQLTSTGAAFGAEWLGTSPRWEPQE